MPTKPEAALVKKDASEMLVERIMSRNIADILPRHIGPERFERILLSTLRKSEKLQKCKIESLGSAVMQAGELGLEPGSAFKECYLVPFGDECTLIIGYNGILTLLTRVGAIRGAVIAEVVFENDEFAHETGALPRHAKCLKGDRGKPYAAFSILTLADGSKKVEVMRWDEIMAIRDRSRGYQAAVKFKSSHPWMTDEIEMAKKTVLLRNAKYVSKSSRGPEGAILERALSHEQGDYNLSPPVVTPVAAPRAPSLRDVLKSAPQEPEPAAAKEPQTESPAEPVKPEKASKGAAPKCQEHGPLVLVREVGGDMVYVCQGKRGDDSPCPERVFA